MPWYLGRRIRRNETGRAMEAPSAIENVAVPDDDYDDDYNYEDVETLLRSIRIYKWIKLAFLWQYVSHKRSWEAFMRLIRLQCNLRPLQGPEPHEVNLRRQLALAFELNYHLERSERRVFAI